MKESSDDDVWRYEMADWESPARLLVARPVDPTRHIETGEVTGWEGNVLMTPRLRYGSPDFFGLKLVETYWELDANIDDWWEAWTADIPGATHVVEYWPEVEPWDWVYVGTAMGLAVLTRHPTWRVGTVRWDENVTTVELEEVA